MTSKSRAAQGKLAELGNHSATFEEQLAEAAKFIDVDLEELRIASRDGGSTQILYHGREEWLLRWLLKKMHSPIHGSPRSSVSSWLLLSHMIKRVSRSITARILTEKKFMTILQQTLEEAKHGVVDGTTQGADLQQSFEINLNDEEKHTKSSRKRKRSGEAVQSRIESSSRRFQELPYVITVVEYLLGYTSLASEIPGEVRGVDFSSEYIKSVIRTTPEEAAKILGSWLSLANGMLKTWNNEVPNDLKLWLVPFIEIWQTRVISDVDQVEFSLHCAQPVLSLLQDLHDIDFSAKAQWSAQLEQLLARNLILPAKASHLENAESELLGTLTRLSVLRDSANGPILFDIAIRSLPSHGARRRRVADEAWLQTVFTTLRESMPTNKTRENGVALCNMLKKAIVHKVDLGLPVLRSITLEYCLADGETNWELLATVIKLDANVFLVLDEQRDLLQDMLGRITFCSVQQSWSEILEVVVLDVVVPLIEEFVRIRDLSSFIQNWYAGLSEFELIHGSSDLPPTSYLGAWEHEALQAKLAERFEASLTTHQIIEILDWLCLKIDENPAAVCVIADAIAGSVSREEVVDAVDLRLCCIMFDEGRVEKLSSRYKWRAWRTLSRTMQWSTITQLERISNHWEDQASPFHVLKSKPWREELVRSSSDISPPLELIEALRCVFCAGNAAKPNSPLYAVVRPIVIECLDGLAAGLKHLVCAVQSGADIGNEVCGSQLTTTDRGLGWTIWSCAYCLLVEFPKALELGLEVTSDSTKAILECVFQLACVSTSVKLSHNGSSWLRKNYEAFQNIWVALLQSDYVSNVPIVISKVIDVILDPESITLDSWIDMQSRDTFAVKSLHYLPFEVFTKKVRERILGNWLPVDHKPGELCDNKVAVNGATLSLKVKIMQRPTAYEGMKYKDLVDLASALAHSRSEAKHAAVIIYKDLVRKQVGHMTMNCDQPRNKAYLLDIITHLKKIDSKISRKSEAKFLRCSANVALLGEVLSVLDSAVAHLDENRIILSNELRQIKTRLTEALLLQLEGLCGNPKKERRPSKAGDTEEGSFLLSSTLDALVSLDANSSKLAELTTKASSLVDFVNATYVSENHIGQRLSNFLTTKAPIANSASLISSLAGDISTVYGRQSIRLRVHAVTTGKSPEDKVQILNLILSESTATWEALEKLLVIRHLIESCDDGQDTAGLNHDEITCDLAIAHSFLCSQLRSATGVRQFSIISETLEMMLRTKGRAMTQWNIDSTLGSITTVCSRQGPLLRPNRSGTIYLHLCRLMQAVLVSHRLKLQGHFHLVVQVMQTLLRCLFIALPHTTARITKVFAPPPWLSSPQHQLTTQHATAYTRLVMLICDPSVSSVTRSSYNNLTSAKDKAKRMAGQHMQYLLTTYIKLQLEMKMLPQVREVMVPGLYAIFDTTTPELRRAVSDGLDASGRALYGVLFRDYQRFGKWKGS